MFLFGDANLGVSWKTPSLLISAALVGCKDSKWPHGIPIFGSFHVCMFKPLNYLCECCTWTQRSACISSSACFSLSVDLGDTTGWFMKEPANNPATLWGLSHILAELFPLRRLHTGQFYIHYFCTSTAASFQLSRDNWQNIWLDVTAMKSLSSYIYHTAALLEKCMHVCMFIRSRTRSYCSMLR